MPHLQEVQVHDGEHQCPHGGRKPQPAMPRSQAARLASPVQYVRHQHHGGAADHDGRCWKYATGQGSPKPKRAHESNPQHGEHGDKHDWAGWVGGAGLGQAMRQKTNVCRVDVHCHGVCLQMAVAELAVPR